MLFDTNFSDPAMLGSGVSRYTFGNWPFTKMPNLMKFHYMLCLSYYIEDGVIHLTQAPDYDFWEMTLHHVIAGMLIFASYMNGFWVLGVKVLIQMDFEDIWVGLSRFMHDFAPAIPTMLSFIVLVISWAYFRLYAFWVTVVDFPLQGRLSIDNHTETVPIISVLLLSLLALNIYWFILLLHMGFKMVVQNKMVDTANKMKLEDKEAESLVENHVKIIGRNTS